MTPPATHQERIEAMAADERRFDIVKLYDGEILIEDCTAAEVEHFMSGTAIGRFCVAIQRQQVRK